MATLTNADVLAGKGENWAARIYRELVAEYGHDALCDAYGLDRDDTNGGTYWADIVTQAILCGDVDIETGELS